VARPEERQVGHDDDGRGGAATCEDGERAIDDGREGAGRSVAERRGTVLARGGHDVIPVGGDEHAVDGGGSHRHGDDAIEQGASDLVATSARGSGEARLAAREAARRDDGPRAAYAHRCERRADHRKSSSTKPMTSAAKRTRSSRVCMTVRVDSVGTRVGASPSSITSPPMKSW
jgi:hypothetical protein